MAIEIPPLDRNDLGAGSFKDYKYRLTPNNTRVRLRLAGSNAHQDELSRIVASGATSLETAISRRTPQQDAVDAPIEVRLFAGAKVSSPVGWVPRGLEAVVDETLSRLDIAGRKQRIPAQIVNQRGLYRVDLLIGLTR